MELYRKTALVTGAAVRVGREIALTLARKGSHILIHYHHSADDAEKTAAEIRALGVRCDTVHADLTRTDSVKRMAADLPDIDILVNSASAYFATPLESVSEADWETLVGSNLKGPFFLSQAVGLRMHRGAGGKIVNICDWAALRPYKGFAPYSAAKAGLLTLTRSLARELAPNVLANAVVPGPILPPPGMPLAEIAAVKKATPLGRWGGPEAVANAVVFLVENDFINGIALVVDGGRSIV